MPRTPAWPPKSCPRLYVEAELSVGQQLTLDGPSAHYLLNVMRLAEGAEIVMFDNQTGEYTATIIQKRKRDMVVEISEKLRDREAVPDLWLCAAPIKRARYDWVAEKACELGVAKLVPVQTQRVVVNKINPNRLTAHLIEAAEQCERTSLPELAPLTNLTELLKNWPEGRHLFFANERGGGSFRAALRAHDGPAAILVGPEGGFSTNEIAAIEACPQAVPISLGPRILRADTAAISAIGIWMAGRGDWDER